MQTEKFREQGIYTPYEEMDEDIVREVKYRILDGIIAIIGGLLSLDGEELERYASLVKNPGDVRSLLPDGAAADEESAALLGGILIRCADWGDTYRRADGIGGHPSDQIAGVLAVCDSPLVRGRDIISAVDTAYRLYSFLQDNMMYKNPNLDYTSTLSLTVPVCAAVCRGKTPESAQNALNLSACGGMLLAQARPSDITNLKSAATGYSIARALWCVRLSGVINAPASMFDGKYGWYNGAAAMDAEPRRAPADRAYEASELKTFPCFHAAQAAVECGLALHDELRGREEDIVSIDVRVSRADAERIIRPGQRKYPENQEEADHNLSYCLVTALRRGALTPRQYKPDCLGAPGTRRLLDMVRIGFLSEEEISAGGAKKGACSVTVTLSDGRRLSHLSASARGSFAGLERAERLRRIERIIGIKKSMLADVYGVGLEPLSELIYALEDHSGSELVSAVLRAVKCALARAPKDAFER